MLTVAAGNIFSENIGELIQAELAEVGVGVKIRKVDIAQYYSAHGGQDLALADWTDETPHPAQKMTFILRMTSAHDYYTRYASPRLGPLLHWRNNSQMAILAKLIRRFSASPTTMYFG